MARGAHDSSGANGPAPSPQAAIRPGPSGCRHGALRTTTIGTGPQPSRQFQARVVSNRQRLHTRFGREGPLPNGPSFLCAYAAGTAPSLLGPADPDAPQLRPLSATVWRSQGPGSVFPSMLSPYGAEGAPRYVVTPPPSSWPLVLMLTAGRPRTTLATHGASSLSPRNNGPGEYGTPPFPQIFASRCPHP